MSKVIVITGASSGIGKATAFEFLQKGFKVYACARRVEHMTDIVEFGASIHPVDITKPEQVEDFIQTVIKEEGKIDVLINNAGFGLYGAVEDITLDQARNQYEVNIFGLAHITKCVLPYMREQKSGRIINISSVGGKVYTPLGAWYHSTKHALEGWSDCLRLELKQFGIKVVLIEPGVIQTGFGDVMADSIKNTSGSGNYQKMAESMIALADDNYNSNGKSSNPTVVGKAIFKAATASNPKTRYAVGYMAKLALFGRRFLGDKLFDKVLLSQLK